MSRPVIELMRCIIDNMWLLATGWKLPGINITPAQGIMFILLFQLVLRFVFSLLNFSTMAFGDDPGRGQSSKSFIRDHYDDF